MSEQKTILPSPRNQDWKRVKIETKKVNKLLKHCPTNNITERNDLIYAKAKLVCDKTGISQRNENENGKTRIKNGYKRTKKLRQHTKLLGKVKGTRTQ